MTYYFKILVLSFFVPFIFSFHPKVNYFPNFKKLIISLPLTSLPFIVWDVIFTSIQVWGFNEEYHSSIYIYNLPLEEVLFFIFIPFCCMYTYHVIEKYELAFFPPATLDGSGFSLAVVLLLVSFFGVGGCYAFFCLSVPAALFVSVSFIFNKMPRNYYFSTFFLLK
jgi:lycopene cyclase domain